MTPSEKILSRLDAVQQRAPGKWLARCPAHDDKRPSLSVQVAEDGETLLAHCFAGCPPGDVLSAVGLNLADLYATRYEHKGRKGPHFTAKDALLTLDFELLFLSVLASDMQAGRPVNDSDIERLALAGRRIERMREICRV